MREEKTFRVVVFRFETDASTNYTRYMITKNYMPFFPGNQWLELKSIRKTSTGKEYAKKLVAFLNWLDSRKVTYENATNHHVREFLHELVFGNLADEKVLSLQSSVGYSTLSWTVQILTSCGRQWRPRATCGMWRSWCIGCTESMSRCSTAPCIWR